MRGHFERHLRDAIALNRDRAPKYAAISDGTSRRISRALIAAEVLILPVARWFDRRAEPYERAGVPLLESVFVSMSAAPPFVAARSPADPAAGHPAPRPTVIRRRVAASFHARSFPGAADSLASELEMLAVRPGMDCLLRHLLESAHRLALLAPVHVDAARERQLRSPAPLLARLLRLHLWGLAPAGVLDRWARPLQARGVAILAQDLPSIPGPGPTP